jgi:hypothetical protein
VGQQHTPTPSSSSFLRREPANHHYNNNKVIIALFCPSSRPPSYRNLQPFSLLLISRLHLGGSPLIFQRKERKRKKEWIFLEISSPCVYSFMSSLSFDPQNLTIFAARTTGFSLAMASLAADL